MSEPPSASGFNSGKRFPSADPVTLAILLIFSGAVLAAGLSAASLIGEARILAPVQIAPKAQNATRFEKNASTENKDGEHIYGYMEAREKSAALISQLSPERIGEMDLEMARNAGAELVTVSIRGGIQVEQAIARTLPTAAGLSAMISSDRDLEDYCAAAARGGTSGRHYAEMAALVPRLRPLRSRLEAFVDEAARMLREKASATQATHASYSPGDRSVGFIARKGKVYAPPPRSLDYAHPFALDIFFAEVEYRGGGAERGPEILSATSGIVVAAASDWRGGGGASTYIEGGISPNSGNGVIVYDPDSRRYFCYFHLSEVAVKTGRLVTKGEVLGRGGDTGANARIKGHGGHLHLEIFDAKAGKPLRAIIIRSLLF